MPSPWGHIAGLQPVCTASAGGLPAIRAYCETDVLNTYLVFLAFERMRGNLLDAQYAAEIGRVRSMLKEGGKPHFDEFLAAWADAA